MLDPDRDSIYGHEFRRKARALEIREICTPVRSPKANAIAERFVGRCDGSAWITCSS